MSFVSSFFLILLATKLVWNLTLPIFLAKKLLSSPEKESTSSSMHISIEIFFLLSATFFSAISTGDKWINNPFEVALWGGLAVLLSYLGFMVLGFVSGWLIGRFGKRIK